MRRLVILFIFFICAASHAEIYQGIRPDSSLGDVKRMFPNALITKVNAAWVTESDGFYVMTGNGLAGQIYLAFSDHRPRYRERVSRLEQQIKELHERPQSDTDPAKLEALNTVLGLTRKMAEEATDEALRIQWVRWVPVSPIPLTRYITKYGKPTKSGFTENEMRQYSAWPARGVSVSLSDDGKLVLATEFEFTDKETKAECLTKYKDATLCN